MPISLMPIADVLRRTGESHSGLYRKMRDGRFPKQIAQRGERPALWNSDDIDDHIASRIAAAGETTPNP